EDGAIADRSDDGEQALDLLLAQKGHRLLTTTRSETSVLPTPTRQAGESEAQAQEFRSGAARSTLNPNVGTLAERGLRRLPASGQPKIHPSGLPAHSSPREGIPQLSPRKDALRDHRMDAALSIHQLRDAEVHC